MKLDFKKIVVIPLFCLILSCSENTEPRHTLVITDDFGCVRGCSTFIQLMTIANTVISAQPDIFCLDAASPDNVNYKSSIGYFITGSSFDSLFAQGYDPYGIMVDSLRAHGIKFLANIRMNDHHGRVRQWAPWSQEHKEWSLGKDSGDRLWRTVGALRQMDYSIQEVQDHRFSILKEITELYPVDGFQLDFIRSTPFLSEPKLENEKFITAYLQRIRVLLDETAKKNSSERLLLGVNLPWDLDFCISEGLDVESWIEKGLVDYIATGEFYYANWNVSLEAWKKIVENSSCKLYPFVMGNVSPYQDFEHGEQSLLGDNKILDGPKIRAIADNYMSQQPDGFAFYNFYPNYFGEYYPELREWTNPAKNRNQNKQYFIGRKTKYVGTEWGNFDEGKSYAFVRDSLQNKGDIAEYKFRFSSSTDQATINLRMAIKYLTADDQIRILLNGSELLNAKREYKTIAYKKSEIQVTFLSAELSDTNLIQGENKLSVELLSQPSGIIETGEYEICIQSL